MATYIDILFHACIRVIDDCVWLLYVLDRSIATVNGT